MLPLHLLWPGIRDHCKGLFPYCLVFLIFLTKFWVLYQKLKGRVKCGKVNCQEMKTLCREAGINAYPTIKLYLKQTKPDRGLTVEGFAAKDYINFVENQLSSDSETVRQVLNWFFIYFNHFYYLSIDRMQFETNYDSNWIRFTTLLGFWSQYSYQLII